MVNDKMLRALVLVTDAYGGRGGIALYNRNLIQAVCEYPGMDMVVAVPRKIYYDLEKTPSNFEYKVEAAHGKLRYLITCFKIVATEGHFDFILCGHLHLLPVAWALGQRYRCPVVPVIYGCEAWRPTQHKLANYLCSKLETFITIRRFTAKRLIEWAKIPHAKYHYLPNCIDPTKYGVKPPRPDLLKRYGLSGKMVVMTSGRLDAGHDLNKGFDEVIEVLPELRKQVNNLVYLIMGDGKDRPRLEAKAKRLRVDDITIFTGYISETEKADHYRLAHAFAMPGSNPEFDRYPYRFAFLEALACGIPVVGTVLEDYSEINDPDTSLIIQVDPSDKKQIIEGILKALSLPKGVIQPNLKKFYYEKFRGELHNIVEKIMMESTTGLNKRHV